MGPDCFDFLGVFVLLASDQDSPVSAIETAAPDRTRFQPLDPGFIDNILHRKTAQILTDDHAPLTHLMGLDPVVD